MQNPVTNTVTISILDREFKIKCPKDKTAELKKAADYLDNKIKEVHRGNRLATFDRVAITAALNIAHELILTDKCLLNLKNKIHQTSAKTKQ